MMVIIQEIPRNTLVNSRYSLGTPVVCTNMKSQSSLSLRVPCSLSRRRRHRRRYIGFWPLGARTTPPIDWLPFQNDLMAIFPSQTAAMPVAAPFQSVFLVPRCPNIYCKNVSSVSLKKFTHVSVDRCPLNTYPFPHSLGPPPPHFLSHTCTSIMVST